MRGGEFPFEHPDVFTWRHEQVPIEPLEFTVDALDAHYRLDFLDRPRMTLGSKSTPILSVQFLERKETIVERIREMRRRAARFSAADAAIVEDDHAASRVHESIGRRE